MEVQQALGSKGGGGNDLTVWGDDDAECKPGSDYIQDPRKAL